MAGRSSAGGGFSLDASVRINGADSNGRERLLRYCARHREDLETVGRAAVRATKGSVDVELGEDVTDEGAPSQPPTPAAPATA